MVLTEFKLIKGFVLDVDGVLTDGTVQVNEGGEQLRTFNIKDGYAMQLAIKKGYPIFIITGGASQGVERRLQGLGIKEIHSKVVDKLSTMKAVAQAYDLDLNQLMYIGDDIPDFSCMRAVGLAVCPADAVEDIKKISHYVSGFNGGKGVVRELIEKVLKVQGNWYGDETIRSI
ncbi:HAD hydrolase family protein [Sphingobacterium sp. N143]|uniref:KdsC family phosphatase n=1 Tax=Sphingobacterium sp. N143 TaxID=2746727 RepID=UPI002576860C|nr:HAD hydrolase family protein [Sphingobacterium sp. N143]MDM1294910.1 HAD hydrolase family protein [Sphingobacterium sp. N143]